jgi:hypothetical protein
MNRDEQNHPRKRPRSSSEPAAEKMARTEPDSLAMFDSVPALKDIVGRSSKAVAGEPLTVFSLLVSLIKSMCPRESIYLKEHFYVVNSMATMVLGDQGAGKSPMMNSLKTVLKLVEKDMQKRFEGFHIPWVLDVSIPPPFGLQLVLFRLHLHPRLYYSLYS